MLKWPHESVLSISSKIFLRTIINYKFCSSLSFPLFWKSITVATIHASKPDKQMIYLEVTVWALKSVVLFVFSFTPCTWGGKPLQKYV